MNRYWLQGNFPYIPENLLYRRPIYIDVYCDSQFPLLQSVVPFSNVSKKKKEVLKWVLVETINGTSIQLYSHGKKRIRMTSGPITLNGDLLLTSFSENGWQGSPSFK